MTGPINIARAHIIMAPELNSKGLGAVNTYMDELGYTLGTPEKFPILMNMLIFLKTKKNKQQI